MNSVIDINKGAIIYYKKNHGQNTLRNYPTFIS